jgi:exoribonuclease II
MSQLGSELIILQALFRKLSNIASAATLEILPTSRSDLLNILRGSGVAMGPTSLTSLRGFHAAPSGGGTATHYPASAAQPRSSSSSSSSLNLAAPVFTPSIRHHFSSKNSASGGLGLATGNLFHQARGATLTTAATGNSRRKLATAAEDVAYAQDSAERVQEGRLVEFKLSNGAHALGLVLRLSPKSSGNSPFWDVEDESGAVRCIREREIVYVLPGGSFTAAQLSIISKESSEKQDVCINEALISLARELSEPGAMYTVPEMAELLFNSATPAAIAAAYKLLLTDALYFKQAGRHPPMYSARSEADVRSLLRAAELTKEAEEMQTQFLSEVTNARKLPRRQRPTQEEWRSGIHGARLQSLEAFALGISSSGLTSGGEDCIPINSGSYSERQRAEIINVLAAAGVQRTPQGAAELLQHAGYWPAHVQLNLLASGLTERFPAALEKIASTLIDAPPPDLDAKIRKDLTELYIVTIDDESTTEIDDGLSAEMVMYTTRENSSNSNGNNKNDDDDNNSDGKISEKENRQGIKVWIHVADPTRWVQPNDPLDSEARRRSKTLYLANGMIPMFPLSLATGPFSLRQGAESCALTVSCIIDATTGAVVAESVNVTPSTIVPSVRLTYDMTDEILEECSADEEPAVHALHLAAKARRSYRAANGSVEINLPEPKMEVLDVDDDVEHEKSPGVTMTAVNVEESLSRQLVAEMMILAGEVCARLGDHLQVPLPYRGQSDPVLPSQQELEAVPEGPCRMALLRGTMTRSITAADSPVRHAGLGLDAYTQVTSPIRRYGDLLAHWQLKAALRGDSPPFSLQTMTDVVSELGVTTQRVSKLERDAQSYWIAHYFKRAMAKNSNVSWDAMCLGWFKQEAGLARVLLEDLGLECLVKVARPASPGTRFKVKCSSADPLMGMYRLDEVMGSSSSSENSSETFVAAAAV